MQAHLAFAFEAVREALGSDGAFKGFWSGGFKFMDRRDGGEYLVVASPSGLLAERMGSGPLSEDSKRMTVLLRAKWLPRVKALDDAVAEAERAEKAKLKLAALRGEAPPPSAVGRISLASKVQPEAAKAPEGSVRTAAERERARPAVQMGAPAQEAKEA